MQQEIVINITYLFYSLETKSIGIKWRAGGSGLAYGVVGSRTQFYFLNSKFISKETFW